MASRGQTPPATMGGPPAAKNTIAGGKSPEQDKMKKTEEEEKGKETKHQQSPAAADEIRPVPDLRVQAGKIEKSVLAFCLGPSKKVNKEQTATIMRYFKDMRGIMEELQLHNSYLTGKLEQSTDSEKKEMKILSA
jgi:hypothetical protein